MTPSDISPATPWSVTRATTLGALAGLVHALATAIIVTWNFRHQILAPPTVGHVQLFDPASKLLGSLYGLPGNLLQHFYGPGIAAKLPLFIELMIANIALGAALGFVLGAILQCCPRAWSLARRITLYCVGFLAVTAALHAIAIVPIILNPHRPQSVRHHLGQIAKRMLHDGPAIDLALTALALSVAVWLAPRLRPPGRMRRGLAAAGAAAVLALTVASSVPALNKRPTTLPTPGMARDSRPRNIVMISIDSLRADHLGCYGYDRATSPRLDEFAAAGVRFDAAYSTSSWTLPSHASMLTGRYPLGHGAIVLDRRLSTATPTLATVLSQAGFATAGFVSFEFLRSRYGFNVGFDYFDDFTTAVDGNNEEHHLTTGPLLNRQILPWIERHADRPFFLFLHYFDVHYDYDPPPPYDTMFDSDYDGPDLRTYSHNPAIHPDMPARHLEHFIALYDGEIRLTDTVVGEVIDAIDGAGIGDDTLIIITADHGEEFFEHGDRGHGTTLYEEVVRVPLLIRWPRGLSAGHVVSTPASLADLAPTIYDLTGTTPPEGVEGATLTAALLGEQVSPHPVYGHLYARKRPIISTMVRLGPDKYVQDLHRPWSELFNLASDPGEHQNLVESAPAHALTSSLLGWLDGQWSAYRRLPTTTEGRIEVDQQNINQLRALGYVD